MTILYMTKWSQLGWEGGWLGYPTAGETSYGPLGSKQEFQGAGLFWSQPTGVYAVGGAIRAKYDTAGGAGGPLGYPTSDEQGTPDGLGRYNTFKNHQTGLLGSIYWHPQHGAHPVSGTIFQDWSAAGYETGSLGYPIADPVQTGDIWFDQQFQHGTLNGTIVINRDLYWPLISGTATPSATARQQEEDPVVPGENYVSDVLPCIEYEIDGSRRLAAFKIRGISKTIYLYCERFRNHMATNPAVSGNPGHFSNYPPTRADWYNFLACTFYTFNGEIYSNVDAGNFGRQRGNTLSGVNSVSIGNEEDGTFVTGWAGQNQYSSQWAGCVQGLAKPWI